MFYCRTCAVRAWKEMLEDAIQGYFLVFEIMLKSQHSTVGYGGSKRTHKNKNLFRYNELVFRYYELVFRYNELVFHYIELAISLYQISYFVISN